MEPSGSPNPEQPDFTTSKVGYKSIVEHSPSAIVVADQKGIVRFVNPAGEVLFNRPADLSVSIGVARYSPEDHGSLRALIVHADHEMYRAKKARL